MTDLALAALATLRLTRFVTQDYLGHWWVVRPARRWALIRAGWLPQELPAGAALDNLWDDGDPHNDPSKAVRLVSGLDCPFCWGFWAGVGVLLSLVIARAVPPLLPAWRFVMGALALNYITGHISSRADG